jgi:hypothetical protein
MAHYADELRLVDARTQYFAANHLDDGGYSARWVKFKVGPLHFHIPNTQARVAAVRFHDLHHLVTGYDTTWVGEAEIGAWEIASGCARHYAAWLLNLAAMTIGLLVDAAKVRRAFMRGRHSRNLYGEQFDEALLLTTVGALRKKLRLEREPPHPTTRDWLAFGLWGLLNLLTLSLALLICFAPVWLLLTRII